MSARTTPKVELTLTAKEREIILAYRTTDDTGQKDITWTALYQAKNWPRRAKPTLRLVGGGAK